MQTLEEIEARHLRRASKADDQTNQPTEGDLPDDDETENPDDDDDDDDTGEPDDLTAAQDELAALKHQMAALQGRLTPAQQQGDEYRRLYQEEQSTRTRERQQLEAKLQELTGKMEEMQTSSNLEDLLSEEERDLFDSDQLKAVAKIADTIAKRRIPNVDVRAATLQVLEERKAQEVKAYRDDYLTDTSRGLSDLSTLASTPKFQEWLNGEDNDDFDPLVNSFLSAKSEKEIDRLGKAIARRVAKFKESRGKPAASRKPDATTSRTSKLQRRPQAPSNEEMKSQLAEAKRLARSRNADDQKRAREILDSLN